jgi:hypothetical protein
LTWYNCLNAVHDSYVWGLDYSEGFVNETYYNWPVSMLQTALEQIVYLTRLNMALYDAGVLEEWQTFYFLLGRLLRTMLIIDPLEVTDIKEVHDKAFGDDDFVVDPNYDPYDGSEDKDDKDWEDGNSFDPYADEDGDLIDWEDGFIDDSNID